MKNYLRSRDRGKPYPIRRKKKHTWVNFSKATKSPNISRVACAVWSGRDKVITDMTTPMGVMPGMSIILCWNSRITASSSSLQATTGTGLCLCYNMYILGTHLRGLRFVVASEWALLSLLNTTTTTTTTSLPQRHCNKYLRGRCVCVCFWVQYEDRMRQLCAHQQMGRVVQSAERRRKHSQHLPVRLKSSYISWGLSSSWLGAIAPKPAVTGQQKPDSRARVWISA